MDNPKAVSSNEDIGENDVSRDGNESRENPQEEETDNALLIDDEQREKLVRLPLGRVKSLIKMDPEVHMVNQEAVFLITKSVVISKMPRLLTRFSTMLTVSIVRQELFIESLAKEAYKHTVQTKKKTVQKRDVESAIDKVDALVFLEGIFD